MQAALDKAGFNAGRPNGKWEPKTPKLNRSFAKAFHMRPPRAAQQLRTGLGSLRTFRELGSEDRLQTMIFNRTATFLEALLELAFRCAGISCVNLE